MPNVLAHGLMAKGVQSQLHESKLLSTIDAYEDVFLFASSGPDFLFYYNMWPWDDPQAAKRVGDYGSLMHTQHINEFVDTMVAIALKQVEARNRDIMLAFIAGYLCHWALDSVAHPFIFYRSGDLQGTAAYDHYQYESNLDSKLVQLIYEQKLSEYKAYRFMNMKPYHEKVVAFLVTHAHQHVYDSTISEADCLTSMQDARNMLKVLYDPYGFKYPLVRLYERLALQGKTPFSSHMVTLKMDHEVDELNQDRQGWCNPTDPSVMHHDSFMQLFEKAVGRAKLALLALEKMLDGDLDTLGNVLLDRSFETDRSHGEPMVVFDNIYR